ncbi:MAG: acyl carrier protein [Pelagibacterales bacterium]|nr:acyl carrier protein [Pelagibacterales bacterium]
METKLLEIFNIVLDNNNKKKIDLLILDQRLQDDIGFDSLELAELTVRIDEAFGVDVFADGIVHTIEDIVDKIKNNE